MSQKLDELPLVAPDDRTSWRGWLAENHAASQGIWLAVGKKGNAVTSLTYDEAVEEALCFGWIDGRTKRLDEDRYRILLTPRKPTSTWSRPNKARVERLIAEGRMMPAGLATIEVAKANGSWNLLDDVDALVIPDDLAAALAASPRAAEAFDGLSETARRFALYWISTAKRPETRAKRIAETVAAALEGRLPR
jgi:uncharacterized protein YdeI (YjbR/CyaY-like superfamily)